MEDAQDLRDGQGEQEPTRAVTPTNVGVQVAI
jgi:hypothetical protein